MVIQLAQLDGNIIIMMFQEKFCLKGEERRAGRTEQTRHIGEASGLEKFSPPSCDTLHLFVVKMTGQAGERTILVKILLNPD